MLGTMIDPRWFDPDAIADAGNVAPAQMQAGFSALGRPSTRASWCGCPSSLHDAGARGVPGARDLGGGQHPVPGRGLRHYIRDLYQENELFRGVHRVRTARSTCARFAARCSPIVATATRSARRRRRSRCTTASARWTEGARVVGGHVGAVVGSRAAKEMYPALRSWLVERLARPAQFA